METRQLTPEMTAIEVIEVMIERYGEETEAPTPEWYIASDLTRDELAVLACRFGAAMAKASETVKTLRSTLDLAVLALDVAIGCMGSNEGDDGDAG